MRILILWMVCWPCFGVQVYTFEGYGSIDLDVLQASLWDVSERTGVELHYGGVVAVGFVPDSIVVRVGSFQEWGGRNSDALASQTHDGDKGSEIVISPYYHLLYPLDQGLVSHEISHALGAWGHSSDPIDTLYPTAGTYGITQNDALGILASPTWPPTKPPSICHAVLWPDYSITIPEISGFRVKLVYVGANKWKVAASGITPNPQGCQSFTVTNGEAILPDVRSQTGKWSARLRSVNGLWELESAKAID